MNGRTKMMVYCVCAITLLSCSRERVLDHAELRMSLASPDYKVKRSAINRLLRIGRERPLTKEEVSLLLLPLESDPDWRIRVRITTVLPFAANKSQVIQPLIGALQERDEAVSGGGNLQIYCCRALAEIGDPHALPVMRSWLAFLESNPEKFKMKRHDLIEITKQWINELEGKGRGADEDNM